ncbi:MAG: toprim domain-containing protein [Nitrososphaerota archaeon]|nr:toprim domain-containing protein [Nitrososphaerota archaeon]
MTVREGKRLDLKALKRAHPLVDLLRASGVALVPSGRDTYRALCPFHEDEHPSLLVDARDQHFHCFGCRVHGDVFDFVMRRDHVDLLEACSRLDTVSTPTANATSEFRTPSARTGPRWERLTLDEQVVMNTAGAVYQQALWREKRALDYVRRRGIPDWVIRECCLGYADGYSLEAYLRRRSGLKVAQDLGLLRPRERGDPGSSLREFLAGRIVVPELRGGQALWFIGRSLDDEPSRPRFLALGGERPILGFERAAGRHESFLVEGVFDYLTAVSWKLPAFSPCGTHLPVERLGFLARARRIWGVFDGDRAGHEANERFQEMLGGRWRALALPEGSDLNDLGCTVGGRAQFFLILSAAREADRRAKSARQCVGGDQDERHS